MKLLDILLGRSSPPKARLDALFALATAYVTLLIRQELRSSNRAGIAFRPAQASRFRELTKELDGLLGIAVKETGSSYTVQQDSYGYIWVVLEDKDMEDLVATVHMVSTTVAEHGYGPLLLAAAFRFEEEGRPVYWVYNYKRGRFYPFVPLEGRKRDNAEELRLKAVMAAELPTEPQLDQWYALWDLPV
ncbi:MAG: hypothetical protein HYY02_08810 [Chloroflexi bacterium]|nr:hypothetical protein [Chloroflexota bacterium]